MKYILIILTLIYLLKAWYVYKLRQKRNRIDFTEKQGKLEITKINNLIDFLNGVWVYKIFTYQMKK